MACAATILLIRSTTADATRGRSNVARGRVAREAERTGAQIDELNRTAQHRLSHPRGSDGEISVQAEVPRRVLGRVGLRRVITGVEAAQRVNQGDVHVTLREVVSSRSPIVRGRSAEMWVDERLEIRKGPRIPIATPRAMVNAWRSLAPRPNHH
jgi:hypothetical protein